MMCFDGSGMNLIALDSTNTPPVMPNLFRHLSCVDWYHGSKHGKNALHRYEPTPLSSGFIYILSNAGRSTLYIGVTADLKKRIAAHQEGHGSIFANAYNLKDLMYYEGFPTIT